MMVLGMTLAVVAALFAEVTSVRDNELYLKAL